GLDGRLQLEKGERVADVANLLLRDHPPARPLALAEAAVVEGHRNVASLGQPPRRIWQDPLLVGAEAVADEHRAPPLARLEVRRQVQIPDQLDAVAVEGDPLGHATPPSHTIFFSLPPAY